MGFYIVTSLECRVHLLFARYQKNWITSNHERPVIYQRLLRTFRRFPTGADNTSALIAQHMKESADGSFRLIVSGLSYDQLWKRERIAIQKEEIDIHSIENELNLACWKCTFNILHLHTPTVWFNPQRYFFVVDDVFLPFEQIAKTQNQQWKILKMRYDFFLCLISNITCFCYKPIFNVMITITI